MTLNCPAITLFLKRITKLTISKLENIFYTCNGVVNLSRGSVSSKIALASAFNNTDKVGITGVHRGALLAAIIFCA
jgi:uncharacterized metal-binding protein